MECWIFVVVFFEIIVCCWGDKENLLEYLFFIGLLKYGSKLWRFFWILVWVLIGLCVFYCLWINELDNVCVICFFVLSLVLFFLFCFVLFVCFVLLFCFLLVGVLDFVFVFVFLLEFWLFFLILWILFLWVVFMGIWDFLKVLVLILCINIFLWGIFLYVVMWWICEV